MRVPLSFMIVGLLACGAAPRRVDTASPARFTQTALPLATALTPYPVKVGGDLSLLVDTGPGPDGVFELNLRSPWAWCQTAPDDCDEGTRRFLVQAINRLEAAKDRAAQP